MEEHKRYYLLTDGEETADLYIFGTITALGQWSDDDPDRSAYNIVKELQDVKAPAINVHINSNGGDVDQGLAIYNTLKNSEKSVTTYCDGFACSAASVVFMAGDKRIMSNASLLMIHNAWSPAVGNADELRKAADDLEKITQAAVEAYKTVATISEDEIKKMMDEETWISASEALEYGFATEITNEEEGEGPKQSAMMSIRDGLLRQQKTDREGIEAMMRRVIREEMAEKPEAKEETPEKQEEKNQATPEKETWAEFIGGKKNEN